MNRFVLTAVLVSSAAPALATDYLVHSAAEIATASSKAKPGDTITMANGNWTNQVITLSATGTSALPITLRAQTPGRVILNGTSRLTIDGNYLVASGLEFKDGALSGDQIVQFTSSTSNSRLTNSAIIDYNPPSVDTRYHWVDVRGQNNRVDHNFFKGQSNSGVTVVVEPVVGQVAGHRIDDNQFVDRPVGTGNGFETIRVGTSDVQSASAQVVVENNLFEKTNGEAETISNKSADNIYRNNTFREVEGTLSLRHGKNATVTGNFFLGNNDSQSGGIRIMSTGHTVTNNYLADLGDRADGAISFHVGQSDWTLAGTPAGYEPVSNVSVINNTIVNPKAAAVQMDDEYGDSSTWTVKPTNVTIANNLISSTKGPQFAGSEGANWAYTTNIAYGATQGVSHAGLLAVNPQLVKDAAGIYRPAAGSPAIDGGTSVTGAPTIDMDGQARTAPLDIGADESSGAAITSHPLSASEVGPTWLNRRTMSGAYSTAGIFFEAENFTAVSDPDNDGKTWQIATASDATGGKVLKASDTSITSPTQQDAVAEYDVAFNDAGTYYVYALARGFGSDSDSLYVPATFGADPTVLKQISSDGVLRWVQLGQYSIAAADVNRPLTLKIGQGDSLVELDSFVISPTPLAVPEPATLTLLGGGAMFRRPRR